MREHGIINRTVLALIGLVLLGGGLLVLAGGADIYRRWDLAPPGGWPLTTPDDVLIPLSDQTGWADQGWWWPTAIAVLALLVLTALCWLAAQSRPHRARPLPVGDPPRTGVRVDDHVLGDALTADLGTLPGVHHAHAHLSGPPTSPQAQIRLSLTPGSTPEHVLDTVRDAVERTRRSAGWDQLPAQVHMDVARHGPRRAE